MTDQETADDYKWKIGVISRAYILRMSGIRNLTFSVYRRGDISDTHTASQVNAPEEVQFDGVIFSDGTTVIHWNTAIHSTSVFENFFDLLEIHGHPEPNYATEFVFEGEK